MKSGDIITETEFWKGTCHKERMDAFYVALYPYSYAPSADSHVSFEAGDVFVLKDNSNSEWWLVSPIGSDDSEFYVPANYIEQMGTTPQDEESKGQFMYVQSEFLCLKASIFSDTNFRGSTLTCAFGGETGFTVLYRV